MNTNTDTPTKYKTKITTFPLIGSKSESDLKLLCDLYGESGCSKFFDPFAGSLKCTVAILSNFPESKAFVADSDTGLTYLYKAMLGRMGRITLEMNYDLIKRWLLADRSYWREVQKMASGCSLYYPSIIAVARYVYQQNVMMSSARYGSNGYLDVSLDNTKYSRLANREFNLPNYSYLDKGICGIHDSYTHYLNDYYNDFIIDSFVNLDPPYFNTGKTKCYKDHDPKSSIVSIDSVLGYLQRNPKMLLAWNFDSEVLNEYYKVYANRFNYSLDKVTLSALVSAKKMKSGSSTSDKPDADHVVWVFRRKE